MSAFGERQRRITMQVLESCLGTAFPPQRLLRSHSGRGEGSAVGHKRISARQTIHVCFDRWNGRGVMSHTWSACATNRLEHVQQGACAEPVKVRSDLSARDRQEVSTMIVGSCDCARPIATSNT
jgi:hypothetical protein